MEETPSSVSCWHCSLDQNKLLAGCHVKDRRLLNPKNTVLSCFSNTAMTNIWITLPWLSALTSLCKIGLDQATVV